jgi:hypothetical protein
MNIHDFLQKFDVQASELDKISDKAISLTHRLDRLKNQMKSIGIFSAKAERFFLFLETITGVHRDATWIWTYLPTHVTVGILNRLNDARTIQEVNGILVNTDPE